MSKRHQALLVLAVSSAVALVVGELAIGRWVPVVKVYSEALADPVPASPAARSDYLPFTLPRDISYRHLMPHFDVTYHFNSLGYRGPWPRTVEKPAGVRRVIVLGDSFTLGWGAGWEQSFVGLVQARFDATAPGEVEVINAAYHAGYSPDAYHAYLRREGRELEPDVLVVVLFSGNDVHDDMAGNLWLEVDEQGAPLRVDTTRVYTGYDGRYLKQPEELSWRYRVPLLRESHLFIGVTGLVKRGLAAFGPEPDVEQAWRRFELTIGALGRLAGEFQADLVYVVIPHPLSSGPRADANHQRMLAVLRGQGHRVVDLAGLLGEDAFLTGDGHFAAEGNRITAEAILEALAATEGLP